MMMGSGRTHIYSLAFGGRGVGKVDGKVCFVEGAVPGEELEFAVVKDTARYTEGTVTRVLDPSPDRIEPVCPYYGRCGGCQLQHISYEKELEYKKTQVSDLISRISGVGDYQLDDVIPSPDCYGYRSSVRLHRGKKGYGLYGRRTHDIIEIDACPVAEKAINRDIKGLFTRCRRDDVTLRSDEAGNTWCSDAPGERFYTDMINGVEMCFSPKAFSQANRYISGKIAEALDEWTRDVKDAGLFDLYCGTGMFSFLPKGDFPVRVGIDGDRVAIDCAKTTLKEHARGDTRFYRADVYRDFFDIFGRQRRDKNVLLLDPPREGVRKDFLQKIKKCGNIDHIFYLSCDASRLARDIRVLARDSVWELERVRPFDMFPRTGHIEVLAGFVRS